MINSNDIRQIQSRCRSSPTWFAVNVLGLNLWQKQSEILNAVRDNPVTCCVSGHSTGKTLASAVIGLWYLYSFPDSIVLTTSSSWLQLERVFWSEVKKLHRNSKINLGGEMLATSLKLDYGWFMAGVSSDVQENFSGYHANNILIVVDESSAIEKPIFESIQGCLSGGENSRLLMIGNPLSPSGVFFDLCKDSKSKVISISSWQASEVNISGLVTRQWCKDRLREWGENSPLYESRVMGRFPSEGSDVLFPLSLVQKTIQNEVRINNKSKTLVGADIARYGDDSSVLIAMRGGRMLEGVSLHGKSTMETTGAIVSLMRKYNTKICCVDVIGIGSGVVDRLREIGGFVVHDVNFAESPSTEKDKEIYENLRAQAYWTLKEDMENSRIQIKDCSLVSELPNIRYSFNSRGKLQIESKELMRKRGVKSPDWSDGLVIANYIRKQYYEHSWNFDRETFQPEAGNRVFSGGGSLSFGEEYDREFGVLDSREF